MAFNLTAHSPTYDTTNEKFGIAALNGGYGVSPTGPAGMGPFFTWECWAKRSAIPGTIQVVVGSSVAGYIGINTSGQAQFNGSTGNITFASTTSICDGNWHHLRMCGNNSGFVGYVDGISVGSSTTVQAYAVTAAYGIGAFDNGSFPCTSMDIDEVAFFNYPVVKSNFTVPVAAYTGNEAGLIALYHLDSTLNDSSQGLVSVLPNNSVIQYSPYNWNVTSSAAQTINSGAYFRTLLNGTGCVLNFNVTNNSTPTSEIYYRIDGYETQAPWTNVPVAATVTITYPTNTSAFPYHLVEVLVKSTSETINRWNTPSNTAVILSSITLTGATNAPVAPVALTKNIIHYGTSISEGVRTVNQTATNDTDRNDALMSWAYNLGRNLGAEIGLIGFGASGLTVTGSGNVPALTTSYNLMYQGQARTFSPVPSLIILEEGTNDGAATAGAVTTALTTVLNGLLTACPGTPIAVMRPYNGTKAAELIAGIAACTTPSLVTYVDTTNYLNPSLGIDSLNLHPSGPNGLSELSSQVANAVRPLLNPRRFNITVTS